MRTAIFAGLIAVVAASPAPQAIDFASVQSAPSPALTGPAITANSQVVSYNAASASASGSAVVTGVASASATATQKAKRNLWGGWGWGASSTTSCTTSTTSTATAKAQSTTSTAKPVTTIPTTTGAQSATLTTSSDESCATTPEAGTYCGFINPEDACAPQPDGYGPHVTPDTPEAFLAYAEFKSDSVNAVTPSPYVRTFVDYNASVSANTYLGLETLKTYDVAECAEYCNNQTLCTGFNTYIERDPSLNPSDNCTQPASITNYKCTLWGSGVDAASATNAGQYRGEFDVVITGSNGYQKTNNTTPATQPGWSAPQQCGSTGGLAHNHPSTCIGTHFFPGSYDPSLCAAFAIAQNAKNKSSSFWSKWIALFTGTYSPYTCNFFNSYMLKKNGKAMGTYCGLYSQQWSIESATYTPGWQGLDFWSIESSFSWSISASASASTSSSTASSSWSSMFGW